MADTDRRRTMEARSIDAGAALVFGSTFLWVLIGIAAASIACISGPTDHVAASVTALYWMISLAVLPALALAAVLRRRRTSIIVLPASLLLAASALLALAVVLADYSAMARVRSLLGIAAITSAAALAAISWWLLWRSALQRRRWPPRPGP